MKTNKFLLILMIGLSIITTSCTSDEGGSSAGANLTYKIDGVAISCKDGEATMNSGLFSITAHDQTQPLMTGISIGLRVEDLKVGTFKIAHNAFSGVDRANAYYLDNSSSGGEFETYDEQLTTDDEVVVTAYDAVGKTISGTFKFTVTEDEEDGGTHKVITDGVFTNIKWE